MKLVNRHAGRIIPRPEISSANQAAKPGLGSKAPHRHFEPRSLCFIKINRRETMSKRAFGILPLAVAAGVVLSGCSSSHQQETLTPTSRTVVTTQHSQTTTTTGPDTETTTTGPVTTTTTRTIIVAPNPPPPPRSEVITGAPAESDVWVSGFWTFSNSQWVWLPGHWEARPRVGAVWVPGHWDRTPSGTWAWTEGHWD